VISGNRDVFESGRAVLAQCGLFRRLSDNEREALFARARMQKYTANESIFLMGSPGDRMVAVLHGTIRISVPSADGKEIVLAILGRGEICGEIALLDGKERTADAKAATDCSVVVLERRDVLAFFTQYPDAWTKLIDVLCERLRTADQQMAEFALSPVPVRLAKALLRLATSDGQALNGRPAERVHLTQRELGNVIGATRESVNKYLRAWQRQGRVQIADRLIVITNRAAVEDLTEPVD
jgi:CRP-like cAMP-binding protein